MKKQLLLIVMLLLPMVAIAEPVEIDGIYYNLIKKNNTAEVASNPNKYAGDVVIPDSVIYDGTKYIITSIGDLAFLSCYDLTSVTIPNSVTSIGTRAFHYCSNLSFINFPNSLNRINSAAFDNCVKLTSITIPNSVTFIGSHAFQKTGLISVIIPNSIETINYGTFSSCKNLTSVTIPNSVTSIGESSFCFCSGLPTIAIPNSVTSIGASAFYGCAALDTVFIPNSVTSIGEWAFRECDGLTTVVLGSGVMAIYNEAFASCPELKDFYSYVENVPATNTNAFKDSYIDYAILHVPESSVNAYKVADPWKNFKSIVAIDGEIPGTPKCEKPTISYEKGQLKMNCATEGVEYVTDITNADIKKHYDANISLTVTYNISVYATKAGFENSETVTATLCWIDSDPKTEGITEGVAQIPSKVVLIQSEGGILKVEGVDDGTSVSIYTTDGKQAGSAVSHNGAALVGINIQAGNTAIVKIGDKSVKVMIK